MEASQWDVRQRRNVCWHRDVWSHHDVQSYRDRQRHRDVWRYRDMWRPCNGMYGGTYDGADGLFTYLRMRIPICTKLKSLPQSRIVPKLAPDQFWTGSASMGTSTSQFQHGAKNRSQFQHWAGANMGTNIYRLGLAHPKAVEGIHQLEQPRGGSRQLLHCDMFSWWLLLE
jgi:hypothetical protein